MSQPIPARLVDTAITDAEKLIASAATVGPRPLSHDDWDSVMERALIRQPSPWRHAPAFALSLALGIAVVLVLRPTPPPPAPRPAELVATAGAKWTHVAPDEVSLQLGRLAVSKPGEAPLRVQTPDAVLETVKSRFLAEVTANGTTVVVEEGEVVVRTRSERHVVRAGESFTWPPPPVIPEQLLDAPAASESPCAPGAEHLSCLSAEANGDGLDAQAALYELGALQLRGGDRSAALATWQRSLDRFPAGVLEPEVRIARLVELVRARKINDAIAEARAFETAFPDDARAGDVKRLRVSLER